MKTRRAATAAAALLLASIVVLNLVGAPSRVTDADQSRREKLQWRLDRVHAEETGGQEAPKATETDAKQDATTPTQPPKEDAMWPETAPDTFKVKFECTNGEFTIECHKDWAPLGIERFYALVREGFFDDSPFFRVVPGFVVQFGLAGDPEVTAKWTDKRIKDDPVTQSNLPGYITFATSGPNTRTTQLFINTGANARLDGMGFAPFGKVIEGLDVVKGINAEYGERPMQPLITREGNAYVRKNFPKIDFIKKASLIK